MTLISAGSIFVVAEKAPHYFFQQFNQSNLVFSDAEVIVASPGDKSSKDLKLSTTY